MRSAYLPYFWNCHSLLSKGQTLRVFNHLEIQCIWKAWLHDPHAAIHSFDELLIEFGWHSIQGSIRWFLQIAQVSTTISHDQNATAVHFLTSNFFLTFCSCAVQWQWCQYYTTININEGQINSGPSLQNKCKTSTYVLVIRHQRPWHRRPVPTLRLQPRSLLLFPPSAS